MVKNAPSGLEVIKDFYLNFCERGKYTMCGYNAPLYDNVILCRYLKQLEIPVKHGCFDIMVEAQRTMMQSKRPKLSEACEYFSVDLENAHSAMADAKATKEVYMKINQGMRI